MIDIPPGDKRVTHFVLELSVPKLSHFEGLAIFAKVVQMHSFVGAATELRLSKATVSKAISRIERTWRTPVQPRGAPPGGHRSRAAIV